MSGAIYCDLKNLAKTIEKELKNDVKQVKYAAMKTLNNVAFEARENLMGEYSKSFTVRNKNLPKAVTVKKATKENLEAEVSFPKDWMLLNTIGGEKRPENSKSLGYLPGKSSSPRNLLGCSNLQTITRTARRAEKTA